MKSLRQVCSWLAMGILWLVAGLPIATTAAGAGAGAADSPGNRPTEPGIRIVVADGQLRSHPFQVFVNRDIHPLMAPRMKLRGAHLVLKENDLERALLTPLYVVPSQARTFEIAGVPVVQNGTLLVFDLSQFEIPWYKAAVRLLPLVEWTETAPDGKTAITRQAIAEDEIHLGNMAGAIVWTLAIVLAVFITILVWSWCRSRAIHTFYPRRFLLLITGPDGFLSLWRAQLMMWTFAVGGLVFLYGLLRLHLPAIPESLVALMGMSLLTGSLSASQGRKEATREGASDTAAATAKAAIAAGQTAAAPKPIAPGPGAGTAAAATATSAVDTKDQAAAAADPTPAATATKPTAKVRGEFADLISSWNDVTNQIELSVPKAQMFTWTVLILGLFIVKSVMSGDLWAVPWQLVALTGVSQAGYVGDKFVKSLIPSNRSDP